MKPAQLESLEDGTFVRALLREWEKISDSESIGRTAGGGIACVTPSDNDAFVASRVFLEDAPLNGGEVVDNYGFMMKLPGSAAS